jgi:hypothetical protein
VRDFFRRLALTEVAFMPAIFSNCDMFLTASRTLPIHTDSDVAAALSGPPQRLLLAVLDLYGRRQQIVRYFAEVELN